VRTVVFSAYEDTKKKALEAGAAAFVTKPDTAKLKETLESLLGVER
jgi:CheY-like chemotaxis protein